MVNPTVDDAQISDPHAARLGHVAIPEGATADGWNSINADGTLGRSLEWSRHGDAEFGVAVDGWQDETGAVTRQGVSVYGIEYDPLTAAHARALAAALIEAADALEQIA